MIMAVLFCSLSLMSCGSDVVETKQSVQSSDLDTVVVFVNTSDGNLDTLSLKSFNTLSEVCCDWDKSADLADSITGVYLASNVTNLDSMFVGGNNAVHWVYDIKDTLTVRHEFGGEVGYDKVGLDLFVLRTINF